MSGPAHGGALADVVSDANRAEPSPRVAAIRGQENCFFLAVLAAAGLLPLFDNGYGHPAARIVGFGVAVTAFLAAQPGRGPGRSLSGGRNETRALALFLAFIVWAAGSILWSIDRHNSLREWFCLGVYGSAFYVAVSCFSGREAVKLVRFLTILGSLLSVAGIAEYLLLNPGRIVATFINPNPLGGYLAMLGLVALPWWLRRAEGGPGVRRLFPDVGVFSAQPGLSVALMLMLTGLALTGSRGAWMAFTFGLCALFALRPQARRPGVVAAAGLLLAAVVLATVALTCLAAWLQQTEGVRRLAKALLEANLIRSESFGTSSVGGRLSFWAVALREAAARPLTGFGLGNYHSVYFLHWAGDEFYSRYAHNCYLQTAADLGLPGMCLLVLAIAFLVVVMWQRVGRMRAYPLALGLFASCISFLFHSGVDFTWDMPAVTLTFWILVGSLLALGKKARGSPNPDSLRPVFRAVALATAVLAIHGWAVDHYLVSGVNAAREGDEARAAAAWRKVQILEPWSPAPWYYFARLWASDPVRAEVAAAEAVKRSPYDGDLRLLLADFQERSGKLEAAEGNLRWALDLGGYYPGPHLALGEFYLRQGRWLNAEGIMVQGLALKDFALTRAPNAGEVVRLEEQIVGLRLGLARAYAKQGKYQEAVGQLAELLRVHPDHALARQLLERYRVCTRAAAEEERSLQASNWGL